jgi:hypothetical protein
VGCDAILPEPPGRRTLIKPITGRIAAGIFDHSGATAANAGGRRNWLGAS